MKTGFSSLVLLVCLLATGCATTLRPTIDYDPAVDFARYQTFSWIDSNPLISAATQRTLSPLVQQRLMSQTQQGLTRRGLRFVEDPSQADLVVAFTIGSREGIRITSYPSRSLHRGPVGRRSPSWGGYWNTSTVRTTQYREGQLAIDMLDVAQAQPVWHGTVSRRITQAERMEPGDAIREAVDAILEQFPPG
jgi:hypothetical protein